MKRENNIEFSKMSVLTKYSLRTPTFFIFLRTVGAISLFFCFSACKNPANRTKDPCASAHEWGEWTVTTVATCTEAGTQKRICNRNPEHNETRDNPDAQPLGHDWAWTDTVTATEDGTEAYTCQRGCGHTEGTSRPTYATGTAGMRYTLISSNTAYSVSRGTVSSGIVHIPVYHRPNANSEYLPVTRIESNAFSNQSGITAVTFLADTKIDFISTSAFQGTGLTSITIPASVVTIGNVAFASCSELASVIFEPGSNLKTIDHNAFNGAVNLTSIEIPSSVTEINWYAFLNCINLETLTLEAGSQLEYIGRQAFRNATKISSITIPATIVDIYDDAFMGWTSGQTIILPFANKAEMLAAFYITNPNWDFFDCNAVIQYTP